MVDGAKWLCDRAENEKYHDSSGEDQSNRYRLISYVLASLFDESYQYDDNEDNQST